MFWLCWTARAWRTCVVDRLALTVAGMISAERIMPAAIVDAQKQFRKFFFGAAVAGLVVGCLILPAQATTINFDGLSGNSCLCVPFTSYKESGFTVSSLSG